MSSHEQAVHRVDAAESLISFNDKDPFPNYEKLRARSSIHWDEGLGGWILLSDELCRMVETREDMFRTSYSDATALTKTIKGGETIAILTGEKHDRARRFHLKLLSPHAVEGYRADHVRKVVNWLIDRFVARGSAELASEFAYQVPTRMITSMFGMDWQSDELVKRIHRDHDTIVAWIGRRNPEGEYAERALEASDDLNSLLLPYIRARQDGSGDDFIAHIWREAPAEYPDLDETEVLAICRELLFAGADTTMQALANALYLILTNAEVRQSVIDDPKTALNNFVEEAFRLYPAAQWRYRIANQDTELDGVRIAKDDIIISVKAAGNRDPKRFACPASIDLARPRPTDHLTFNVGPRSCAGARLARAEMREVIQTALTRLVNLRLDPAAPPPRLSGVYMQGFRPLNVLFDPA